MTIFQFLSIWRKKVVKMGKLEVESNSGEIIFEFTDLLGYNYHAKVSLYLENQESCRS